MRLHGTNTIYNRSSQDFTKTSRMSVITSKKEKDDYKCSRYCRIVLCVLLCLSMVFTAFLLVGEFLFDSIETNLIAQNLVITEDSLSYNLLAAESEGLVQFFLFNVTNSEEWSSKRAKMRLRAVGPYTYRKVMKKSDMKFAEDESGRKFFYFNYTTTYFPEQNNSKKDRVILPNFVKIIVDSLVSQSGSPGQKMMWKFLKKPEFLDRTADEIIWGYNDPILTYLKSPDNEINPNIGLFKHLNNSVEGPFKMDTGVEDITRLGDIVAYKNKTHIDNWGSDYANMINGSNDIITPPSVKMSDRRYFFGKDICRSVPFVAKEWVSAVNYPKLKLLNMELEERTFYSSEKEPDNAAFHVNVYPTDKHPPSGLWSMSPCLQFGVEGSAPLFVSQPFFGEAADEVKDGVIFEGDIEPNLKIHLHIDPKTGILMKGAFQYQLNLFMAKQFYKTENDTYIPLAYVKDVSSAKAESAERVYKAVYEYPMILRWVVRSLLGYFIIQTIITLAAALILQNLALRRSRTPNKETEILEDAS